MELPLLLAFLGKQARRHEAELRTQRRGPPAKSGHAPARGVARPWQRALAGPVPARRTTGDLARYPQNAHTAAAHAVESWRYSLQRALAGHMYTPTATKPVVEEPTAGLWARSGSRWAMYTPTRTRTLCIYVNVYVCI